MCDLKKTEKQEIAFYMKCRKEARSKGYPAEVYEDFPSWAYARMKEGSNAPISFLLIDYLRITRGVKGSEGQKMRKEVNNASCNMDEIELTKSEVASPSQAIFDEDLWDMVKGEDRAMLQLYFKFGFSKKEIGEMFGLTEGRISQKMAEVISGLKVKTQTNL